jgi:AraC-like DNA-binding protein
MLNKNICLFTNKISNFDSLYASNFVLETNHDVMQSKTTLSTYRIHLIIDGEATLQLNNQTYKLKKGDVFIGKPTFTFYFMPSKNFKFFYVSFLGNRASYFIDKISLTDKNCIFPDLSDLFLIWQNSLKPNTISMDIRLESIILYTFSSIMDKYFDNNKVIKKPSTAQIIKKFLDENFFNNQLNLTFISKNLNYSEKYISTVFKKFYNLSVFEYVNNLRINNALSLIECGITGIKNIAFLSGFNDPLYFSKVFKKYTGVSPKQKIKSL